MFPHLLLGLVMERIDPGFSLRHVAFFFCRLSPTQRNNDIGNQELLAIKLALEEWPHWLEGTEQPFIIWTDHKTSHASSQLSGKTHIRQGGLYTLEVLTFTSQVPVISNLMPCHASTFWRTLVKTGPHPAFCIAAITWEMESLVKKAQIQQPDIHIHLPFAVNSSGGLSCTLTSSPSSVPAQYALKTSHLQDLEVCPHCPAPCCLPHPEWLTTTLPSQSTSCMDRRSNSGLSSSKILISHIWGTWWWDLMEDTDLLQTTA